MVDSTNPGDSRLVEIAEILEQQEAAPCQALACYVRLHASPSALMPQQVRELVAKVLVQRELETLHEELLERLVDTVVASGDLQHLQQLLPEHYARFIDQLGRRLATDHDFQLPQWDELLTAIDTLADPATPLPPAVRFAQLFALDKVGRKADAWGRLLTLIRDGSLFSADQDALVTGIAHVAAEIVEREDQWHQLFDISVPHDDLAAALVQELVHRRQLAPVEYAVSHPQVSENVPVWAYYGRGHVAWLRQQWAVAQESFEEGLRKAHAAARESEEIAFSFDDYHWMELLEALVEVMIRSRDWETAVPRYVQLAEELQEVAMFRQQLEERLESLCDRQAARAIGEVLSASVPSAPWRATGAYLQALASVAGGEQRAALRHLTKAARLDLQQRDDDSAHQRSKYVLAYIDWAAAWQQESSDFLLSLSLQDSQRYGLSLAEYFSVARRFRNSASMFFEQLEREKSQPLAVEQLREDWLEREPRLIAIQRLPGWQDHLRSMPIWWETQTDLLQTQGLLISGSPVAWSPETLDRTLASLVGDEPDMGWMPVDARLFQFASRAWVADTDSDRWVLLQMDDLAKMRSDTRTGTELLGQGEQALVIAGVPKDGITFPVLRMRQMAAALASQMQAPIAFYDTTTKSLFFGDDWLSALQQHLTDGIGSADPSQHEFYVDYPYPWTVEYADDGSYSFWAKHLFVAERLSISEVSSDREDETLVVELQDDSLAVPYLKAGMKLQY
ncbi:MAG: hypothetical protein KatS3mg111_2640 [Pirellulaceae bacterium]|nr:MAG: hypothetical protein KatS3mg111_2640 [Pirellulaceae bacterium]